MFPPVVLLSEAKHFTNFAIGQQTLIVADLALEGHIREELLGQFAARRVGGYRVVRRIEDLITQS